MRKHKTRLVNRNRGGGNFQQAFIEMEAEEPEEIRIVRSKKFAMKPMDPEEACIQMELSGHNFFVFRKMCIRDRNVVEYFVSYYDYYQPEAYVPQTDTYIAKDSAINDEIDKLRHSATAALTERDDVILSLIHI